MKRGFFSIETLFMVIFAIMLGATILSVFQFVWNQNNPDPEQGSPQQAYHNLFLHLQQDARFSHSVSCDGTHLDLLGNDDRRIRYSIASQTVIRVDKSGYQHVLLRNIASGGWSICPPPRRLFGVWLIPGQQMGHPFFTSFALRGKAP